MSVVAEEQSHTGMRAQYFRRFEDIPAAFQALLAEQEKRDFFNGLGWYRNFSATCLEERAMPLFVCIEDASGPCGFLAMRSPAGQNGSELAHQFIGRHSFASLTNHQSLRFAPVIAPHVADVDAVAAVLARALFDHSPTPSLIDLTHLDPQARGVAPFIQAMRKAGFNVFEYDYRPYRCERLEGKSYKDYIASRSSNTRRAAGSMRRKIEKLEGFRAELVTDMTDIEQRIADYQKVHAKSWKEPEPFPLHTPGVIREAARAGALRLVVLYVKDDPIATNIAFVTGGRSIGYKHHFDPDYGKLEAGKVAMCYILEQVIDVDRVQEIDFGVGDEPAKHQWVFETRTLRGVAAFNPRSLEGLVAATNYLGRAAYGDAKRLVKGAVRSLIKPGPQKSEVRSPGDRASAADAKE